MKTTVYLVRHGEVHNPDDILYERTPGFHLSERGREQVHKLGKFLSTEKIHAIYASPLERTRETAEIIASYHGITEITPDERLLEVRAPALVGKKLSELVESRWNLYMDEFLRAGGETLEEIYLRMHAFLSEAAVKHADQAIVVVSHGDPVVATAVSYLGKPLHIDHMRGSHFIPTARGYKLVFRNGKPEEVTILEF